ncbi:hypothetical protein EG68_07512 [Paragonimus skrjabini miyazakii]|uniref:Uncharacterized protein n=1 Tax=Paragonimus skrjabini miyazakii TaxID=59628 RepID=A0A8S9YTN4_9TREM|nr:hypothetical protein EG68_07512 [Paragonimus skrjabini miyazakii]
MCILQREQLWTAILMSIIYKGRLNVTYRL